MATHPQTWGKWYDNILNTWPLMIDDASVHTIGIAWLFKEMNKWVFKPRITGDKQFYNAVFFIRVGYPFAIFIGIRYALDHLFQGGIGWKQNGRFAILCRFQTDESAARGTHAPNLNQAQGWDYGVH